MKDLRKLTNSYRDVRLYDLGIDSDGEGPYVLWQRGYPPESVDFKVESFLLNKEGQWETVWRWVSATEEKKNDCLFDSVPEAIELLEKVAVEDVEAIFDLPEGVSEEQARRDFEEGEHWLIQQFRKAKGRRIERLHGFFRAVSNYDLGPCEEAWLNREK
jgi:hypothetical protein